MCGIAGVLDLSGRHSDMPGIVEAMASTMRHRGPDDSGVWVDLSAGIAFGHRRLAIVDLTEEGHQPMTSADGRYVIVFNGEIYNHRELRNRLKQHGHRFRGHSDTEVLLAAVTEWGARDALDRLNGMFAYGLWDRRDRKLHLVRDRVGEKPLYYGRVGSAIIFASELKAFWAHPDFEGEIDRASLAAYFRHKYVPSPHSIYRDVSKLPPGTILTIPGSEYTRLPDPIPHWDAAEIAERGLADPFLGTPSEAEEALLELLTDAVGARMQADVPVGAFLSGGVDSSTVAALMQVVGDRAARTFTIGSTDERYDEARDARSVAAHLGTDHTDLLVTPREAMDVIPRLPTMYDEPFADSSQIPTFLVSQLARGQVTVALTGDGGDELFAGYDRYLWLDKVWNSVGWMPTAARGAAARAITSVSPTTWQRLFSLTDRILPDAARHRMVGDKVHKLAGMLDAGSALEAYVRLISHWRNPSDLVVGGIEPATGFTSGSARWGRSDVTEMMMYLDLITYLPDDILAKVDRASMSVSLEARVPLLDHRVIEFAWRLPSSLKVQGRTSKWLLRQVLSRYVPTGLIDRPKSGFGIPIAEWLRGPLRSWAEDLLEEHRLRAEGFLRPDLVRTAWSDHLSGRRNLQYPLWDVLMFESWLETPRRAATSLVAV